MATINTVPPRLDIIAYGGDDTRLNFTFTQDDGETPYELIGTHVAQVRPDQNSDTVWNLEVILDPNTEGLAYLVVPSEVAAETVIDAATDSIFVGEEVVTAPMFRGVWDWEFTNSTNTKTLVFGNITIIGEVTK
jgi:hypothetical protein